MAHLNDDELQRLETNVSIHNGCIVSILTCHRDVFMCNFRCAVVCNITKYSCRTQLLLYGSTMSYATMSYATMSYATMSYATMLLYTFHNGKRRIRVIQFYLSKS